MEAEKRERAFVVMLEAVDEVIGARAALAEALKKGVFNISRARYSMGDSRVGRLQYEGREMETTAMVTLREGSPQGGGEQGEGEQSVHSKQWLEFALSSGGGGEGASNSVTPPAAPKNVTSAPEEGGLRKRHIQSQSQPQTSTSQSAAGALDDDSMKGKDRAGPEQTSGGKTPGQAAQQQSTPLAWFSGGVVSPALREAKTDFSHALQEVLHLANAVSKLNHAEQEYSRLVSK
mmetsp:Transcript_39137/g.85166  ORF Transcript_39137/g.85166 Transcript_39137/m.85166 type:complete len:233 (-) Transcript_39137:58-756(-)